LCPVPYYQVFAALVLNRFLIMEPKIDYSSVNAVPHQQTLALVNSFVIQTVEFINRFASVCEEKLGDVSSTIRRLEVTVTIFEAKLDSIKHIGTPSSAAAPSAAAAAASGGTGDELPPAVPIPAGDVAGAPGMLSGGCFFFFYWWFPSL
jgi:hypothetical protein